MKKISRNVDERFFRPSSEIYGHLNNGVVFIVGSRSRRKSIDYDQKYIFSAKEGQESEHTVGVSISLILPITHDVRIRYQPSGFGLSAVFSGLTSGVSDIHF